MGSGVGKGVRPGWALGRPEDIGKAIWQTQGDDSGFRVGRVDSPFARETVLGAPGNLTQAPAAADTSNEDWGHAILSRSWKRHFYEQRGIQLPEFLTTTGISYRLEEIIKGAHDRLFLISPFLKINPRLRELLEDQNRFKRDVRVIYGKSELRPEENNWLASMTSIRTSFCKDLHAKCYLNENEALLTSMNLYEYSQQNNYEMGILVSREKDPDLYEEIAEEARRIERASEAKRVTVARVETPAVDRETPAPKQARRSQAKANTPTSAFCIRCKSELPANPLQPYCSRCFSSWKRYENPDYEEKHCHTCGKEHKATMSKPVCIDCFRKYRRVLTFQAV